MQRSKPLSHSHRDHARPSLALTGLLLLVLGIVGCGSSNSTPASGGSSAAPQTYFAPTVAGTLIPGPSTYSFDSTQTPATFGKTIYNPLTQPGPQIVDAGLSSASQRGLLSLGISTAYAYTNDLNNNAYLPIEFTPPATGSFAVQLPDQAGGLVQLLGWNGTQLVTQPAAPLVTATQCPNFSSPQSYQFITIPAALIPAGTAPTRYAWDPTTETAFGSVDISSSGNIVNFQNIRQFRLPSGGGTGAPVQAPSSSLTGICAQTYFGYTIAVPGQEVITNPVAGGTVSPQAIIGIGASGLLVEDNGSSNTDGTLTGSSPPLPYDNILGAGTGAVGLPRPSAALDSGAVVGAQYIGFIYAAGVYNAGQSTGWSSHLASFGFSQAPQDCASVAPGASTLIYGGDFSNDDPSTSSSGFGNCDFAIDLGSQDSANNGRYPHATVWVGADYAANSTGVSYSFPAIAITAQLNGKYAIFLIGVDSSQPWAIYLLQSN